MYMQQQKTIYPKSVEIWYHPF